MLIQRMEPIISKMGHSFSRDTQKNCNVYLAFIRISDKTNLPTAVRIDGIYYDIAKDYKNKNVGISQAHSSANAIIYQSSFSQKMCEKYLTPRRKGSIIKVIHNGIQLSPINKVGKINDEIDIVVLSKWRRHKRLKEIIEIFLQFQKSYKNSTLHILGKLHDNSQVNHKKIKYYGMLSNNEVFNVLKKSDLTLHLSKRDSCPNSVVECISLGIPVISTNNCGGATEICLKTDGCIVCPGDGDINDLKPCYPYSEDWNIIDYKLRNCILTSMNNIVSNRIRCKPPETISIEYCCEQYLKVLKEIS